MRTVVTAAAVLLAVAGCATGATGGYDEAAHRRAAEDYHGMITDWGTYRRGLDPVCESEDLGVFVLGWMAEGDMGPLVLEVHYRCPERMGELAPLMADYGV